MNCFYFRRSPHLSSFTSTHFSCDVHSSGWTRLIGWLSYRTATRCWHQTSRTLNGIINNEKAVIFAYAWRRPYLQRGRCTYLYLATHVAFHQMHVSITRYTRSCIPKIDFTMSRDKQINLQIHHANCRMRIRPASFVINPPLHGGLSHAHVIMLCVQMPKLLLNALIS